MKSTGIVLVILGIVMSIFNAFKFFTKEKVVDLGVIEITRDKPNSISWSPILGIAIIVVGVIILYIASRKGKIV